MDIARIHKLYVIHIEDSWNCTAIAAVTDQMLTKQHL